MRLLLPVVVQFIIILAVLATNPNMIMVHCCGRKTNNDNDIKKSVPAKSVPAKIRARISNDPMNQAMDADLFSTYPDNDDLESSQSYLVPNLKLLWNFMHSFMNKKCQDHHNRLDEVYDPIENSKSRKDVIENQFNNLEEIVNNSTQDQGKDFV